MSRRSKWWLGVLLTLAALLALLFVNRLHLLKYSLGWYTDFHHPREPNRPVPWMTGPAQPGMSAADRPPNIIVILADDLGINDVTAHGGGLASYGVPTPHIDSIARDGVRFANGYAGAPVCTVSRAALLTGRYPWRFGVEFTPTPGAMARVAGSLYADPTALHPVMVDHAKARTVKDFNELGMPPTEITIADALRTRGYHNVHIGKWHLGSTKDMRPNKQGFDETLFMESGLHLPEDSPRVQNSKQDFDPIDKFLWPNMRFAVSYQGGSWFEPAKYLADYYTDEAITVIERNRHRPFFLYLAHWGVHTPLQAAKEDYDALPQIKDHRMRVYAAMVRSMDRSVGRILQALRERGLDQNTLVVFTSDNGAPGYVGLPDLNKPYRGWKLTMFEGGLKVPYVAKWPAKIPAGQDYKPAITNVDLFPTLLAAAGVSLPQDRPIDGVNLLPYLGAQPGKQADRALHWRDGEYRAMQEAGWKLIVSQRPAKTWLFNLNADPTERNNLAQAEPQRAADMLAKMRAHHAQAVMPLWPSFIELPIAIDKTLDQRMTASDEYTYWSN